METNKTINFSNTQKGKEQAKRLVDCRLKMRCNSAKEFFEKYSNEKFSYTQYQKYEAGERLLSKKAAMLYSSIFNVDWEWLKDGDNDELQLSMLNKIGYVQAGVWQEACELPEDEWKSVYYPINDNLKNKRIFALGVRGNSMNKIFPPEKTTLICCCMEDWEFPIENGDYVIAYRESIDGRCEATVKKFMQTDNDTVVLIAESTDPTITNIILHPDDNEYRIGAIVIDYQIRIKDF